LAPASNLQEFYLGCDENKAGSIQETGFLLNFSKIIFFIGANIYI